MTRKLLIAIAAALGLVGTAPAQVVADSACEKHAVDIAAFATCDSATRVARAEVDPSAKETPRIEDRAGAERGTPDAETGRKQEPTKPATRRLARSKAR